MNDKEGTDLEKAVEGYMEHDYYESIALKREAVEKMAKELPQFLRANFIHDFSKLNMFYHEILDDIQYRLDKLEKKK